MCSSPFNDMPDAELGALTRRTMAMLADQSDERGIKRIAGTSGALFLIGLAVEQNSATMTVTLGGATVGQKDTGDWTITVRRPGADLDEDILGGAPVVLAGSISPGRIGDAIGCFERLTVYRVKASEPTLGACPVCGEPIRNFWDGFWHGLGALGPCLIYWIRSRRA